MISHDHKIVLDKSMAIDKARSKIVEVIELIIQFFFQLSIEGIIAIITVHVYGYVVHFVNPECPTSSSCCRYLVAAVTSTTAIGTVHTSGSSSL